MPGQYRIVITEGPATIEVGQQKRVSWVIYDPNDNLVSPTTVTITLNPPLLTSGTPAAVTADSTGTYHFDLTGLTTPGRWKYIIAATTPTLSESGAFHVVPAAP